VFLDPKVKSILSVFGQPKVKKVEILHGKGINSIMSRYLNRDTIWRNAKM